MKKNHTMYLLKVLTDYCIQRQNQKIAKKNTSVWPVYKITEELLSNHKKQCLLINGCQAVNFESGIKKITNYEKQVPAPFNIYAVTECFF